jgi:peptidoglycan-N-acetylglucosamine deacetylase
VITFAYLAAAAILVLLVYIGLPTGFKYASRRRFLSGITATDAVCITFDDGPDSRATADILRLLRENKAKATFFLLGKSVEEQPHLVRMILQDGHEIGEHSYGHLFAWTTGPLATWKDLCRGKQSILRIAPEAHVRFFRPPHGKLNAAALCYAWWGRKDLAWWDLDPKDYRCGSSDQLLHRTLSKLRPGSVVLLHDGRRNNSAPSITTRALPGLLKECAARRLKCVTLSTLAQPGQRRIF